MATPTEWLDEFQVNTGSAATGGQSDPHIIGLANGNILVVWTEGSDGAINAAEPGSDIIAKIYDAEGNVVRDSYSLGVYYADDERDIDVAATNDGGFVLVLVDDSIANANETAIRWQSFNAAGDFLAEATVATENVAADNLSNPQVVVNQSTNESIVTFTDNVGGNENINFVTVSISGAVGPELGAAQNSVDFDRDGDVALLANGNFVSVYEENDSGTTSIEFEIFDTSGTSIIGFSEQPGNGGDPSVTALANGNFVVVWEDTNGDIRFGVYNPTGGQVAIGTAAGTADAENEPDVVALPDGGFVIVWDNDSDFTLEARRFNADGTADGNTFIVGTNDAFEPDISVTADGRILFTWRSDGGGGEIYASIWDPRTGTIDASDYDQGLVNFVDTEVVTGLLGDTVFVGDAGANTYFGQSGNDTFTLGTGDTAYGGAGNDTFFTNGGNLTIFAGAGNDLVIANNFSSETFDGGSGNDTIDLTSYNGTYTIDMVTGSTNFGESYTDFENLISGNGNDTITGTGGANTINTNGGNDTINAGFGDDTLVGGEGDDTLNGQGGNDTASYYNAASAVTVTLQTLGVAQNTIGAGTDTLTSIESLTGSAFDDSLTGSGVANIIQGLAGDDYILGLSGADKLYGGDGSDQLVGGFGFDRLEGGAGVDSLIGNFGNDVMLGGSGNDIINGNNGNDTIYGEGDNDTIDGGVGMDSIFGGTGDDSINGGVGIDTIQGDEGNDIISGGAGDDTIDGGDGSDTIDGGIGEDTIFGGLGVDDIFGANGNDVLYGGDQGDFLAGGLGADELHGGTGSDDLSGDAGADDLFGDGGNDTLAGGLGVDTLTGGTGSDMFVFATSADSSSGANGADTITDFSKAQGDRIDLSAIDANTNAGGNQGFAFVGQAAFTGTAGELRFTYDGGGDTLVQMDVDGDGASDMTIRLTGEIALTGAQFVGLAAAELPDEKLGMVEFGARMHGMNDLSALGSEFIA